MGFWGRVRAGFFSRDDPAPVPEASAEAATVASTEPTAAGVAPPVDASMRNPKSQASVASRQERAASRVLDDEGLRGGLADDEFQPLLDWALAETDRVAASTDEMSDDQADALIDKSLDAIREVVRSAGAAVTAHGEGDAKRRAAELAFTGDSRKAKAELDALERRLDREPDLTGAEVATLIVGVLGRSPEQPVPTSHREKTP